MLIDGDFRATWRLVTSDRGADLKVDAEPLSGSETSQVEEEGRRVLAFLRPGQPGEVRVIEG